MSHQRRRYQSNLLLQYAMRPEELEWAHILQLVRNPGLCIWYPEEVHNLVPFNRVSYDDIDTTSGDKLRISCRKDSYSYPRISIHQLSVLAQEPVLLQRVQLEERVDAGSNGADLLCGIRDRL